MILGTKAEQKWILRFWLKNKSGRKNQFLFSAETETKKYHPILAEYEK